MTTTENEVLAADLEIFTLCVPKSGPPNRDTSIQGTPVYIWELTPTAADQLERTIRLASSDVRRGRPLIHRSGRRLLPEKGGAEEEKELVARAAATGDLGEVEAAVEVASLKTLRRELGVEIEVRRRELARVEAQIEETRRRVAEEEERQSKRVAAAVAHGQQLVKDAQEHYDARLRAVWALESGMEVHTTKGLERLGDQVRLATEAKRQVDRILTAQTAGELLGHVKENVELVLNSPMGQAAQTAIGAKMAKIVSTRLGHKIETEDALAAIVLQGRAFRERMQLLVEMEQATPPGNWRAKALVLGATFAAGSASPKMIAEFIGAGNNG